MEKWKPIFFFFLPFSIWISIDPKWSKTYDFECKKIQNNFQIHMLAFQNILHLSFNKKNLFSCWHGVDPPPLPPVYGHIRTIMLFCTTSLTQHKRSINQSMFIRIRIQISFRKKTFYPTWWTSCSSSSSARPWASSGTGYLCQGRNKGGGWCGC